ncbi:MAG: UpxY family transcription antiterminator [Leptospiraceae bacterium]|nr:UpxY family transcription antiterminator [Leptospiraceae bacterium]MCP5512697.1 UpxY family transcription antiterminator [Leptospiraceae bacterium]
MSTAGLLDPIYDEANWFALYTKPRTEKKLNALLRKHSVDSYLPLIPTKKKWSDRIKTIELPLFTSYLFVKIKYREEALKVLKLPQSVGFVFQQGKPAILDEEEIEIIKMSVEEFPDRIKVREEEMFQKGREVKIHTGPFAGRNAIIEKIKNKVFVVLKVKSIQKTLLIEVHKEDIGFDFEF